MFSPPVLFTLLVYCSHHLLEGSKLETIKHCCGLGKNYAESDLRCDTFQPPIAGIPSGDEKFCLNYVKTCCKKQYREKQCELGKKDAYKDSTCGLEGSEERKGCCEACKIGLEAAAEGSSCDVDLDLGPLTDAAFSSCCEATVTVTTASTTSATTPAVDIASTAIHAHSTITAAEKDKEPESSSRTPDYYFDYNLSSPAPPPLEGVCDIPEICAHLCIKTPDSYRCECHKGYTLMSDGVSCKLAPESTVKDRCAVHNPCDHECLDTGVAIKCLCDDGFKLAKDKRTCNDVDECALGTHDCGPEERCVNTEGEYECVNINSSYPLDKNDFLDKCPEGYIFNSEKMVCDDIDECELQLVCSNPGSCINTIGSYECQEVNLPTCPPGFQFRDSIQACADIDECITGDNNCNPETQVCLNNKGNYVCIDKSSDQICPPGFKKNPYNQLCMDINECLEVPDICDEDEECENEPGSHSCIKKVYPYTNSIVGNTSPTFAETTDPTEISRNVNTSSSLSSTSTTLSSTSTTLSSTLYYDTNRSNDSRYEPSREETKPKQNSRELVDNESQVVPTHSIFLPSSSKAEEPPKRYPPWIQPNYFSRKPPHTISTTKTPVCPEGYRYSTDHQGCTDINECIQDEYACDSNQDCYNTPGSYVCTCKNGFQQDRFTEACVDINECQIGQDNCGEGQRCDNTIGSYFCARVAGCGTGYTLNTATGLCEDDDECSLGTHNCQNLGSRFICRNIPGSYRCILAGRAFPVVVPLITTSTSTVKPYNNPFPIAPSRSNTQLIAVPVRGSTSIRNNSAPQLRPPFQRECLPGYRMGPEGRCEDINECESSPCRRGEKCINLQNRYQCIAQIQCRSGYELNEEATECIDINECTRGLHKCQHNQICKNGPGYYLCQCPTGYKMHFGNSECEDIDECEFYRGGTCSENAVCHNTIGSYKCVCKEGFRENEQGCGDVDECAETPNLCHHNCINQWGSYRCACERGFTLNYDNRTCTDIDECERFKDRKLCIGTCQNIPGSYSCTCPEGYRLGSDGRTCQDIDECTRNPCPNPDDICFNVRGGYRCQTIQCPPLYIRDPKHKGHCKRASNVCNINDLECIQMPQQYSYYFVSLVSNLPIPENGVVEFFRMKGPQWIGASAEFNMDVKNVRCPSHVKKADGSFFNMNKSHNMVILGVVRPIEGPQEIEVQLQMRLYVGGVFQSRLISTILIIVTEYPF